MHDVHDLTSFAAFFCPLLILLNTPLLLVQTLGLEATAPLPSNPRFGKGFSGILSMAGMFTSTELMCALSVFGEGRVRDGRPVS